MSRSSHGKNIFFINSFQIGVNDPLTLLDFCFSFLFVVNATYLYGNSNMKFFNLTMDGVVIYLFSSRFVNGYSPTKRVYRTTPIDQISLA
jgi:hypothetical protein